MTTERALRPLGWRIFGLGLIAMATVWLAWGDFTPGQPVPERFSGRTFAYLAAVFTLIAGAAIEWRRSVAAGAAAIAIYYLLIVVIVMDGPGLIDNYTEYGSYSNIAEQLAIAAAALIIYASVAKLDSALAVRLTRIGQLTFGVCAVLFGGAHYFYMNLTVPLIPKWLPPSAVFWAYATGVGQIAAGIAILTGVQARLGTILLTTMYVLFTLLVHIPIVLADPANFYGWTENALNLALIGSAWVVADSLGRQSSSMEPLLVKAP
jgi:uncharacterized membrane protein YphA (DoxX/SURF4 family)